MIIEPLTYAEYLEDAATYDVFTASALDYSYRPGDTVRAVVRAMEGQTAIGVRVVDDDQVVAFGVLEKLDTKGGKMLNIWTMAGDRMAEWLQDFLTQVESVAVREECMGVMLGGRLGWHKELRHFGYGTDSVIMSKRVNV